FPSAAVPGSASLTPPRARRSSSRTLAQQRVDTRQQRQVRGVEEPRQAAAPRQGYGQPGDEERQRQRDQRRRPHDPRVVLPGDEEPGGEEGERVARAQRPPPHDDERDAAGPVLD